MYVYIYVYICAFILNYTCSILHLRVHLHTFTYTFTFTYIAVTYNTLHYTTLHYTTLQYNTIQYNTIQYIFCSSWADTSGHPHWGNTPMMAFTFKTASNSNGRCASSRHFRFIVLSSSLTSWCHVANLHLLHTKYTPIHILVQEPPTHLTSWQCEHGVFFQFNLPWFTFLSGSCHAELDCFKTACKDSATASGSRASVSAMASTPKLGGFSYG